MKSTTLILCLSAILLTISTSVTAQHTDNIVIRRNDSILHEITNINKQVKSNAVKDTASVPVIYQLIDSIISQLDRSKIQLSRLKDVNLKIKTPAYSWTPFDSTVNFHDTIIIDPVFLPIVFDGKILPSNLNFLHKQDTVSSYSIKSYHLINPDSTFTNDLKDIARIQATRRHYYLLNPDKVHLNEFTLRNIPIMDDGMVEKPNPLKELLKADNTIEINAPEVETTKIKQLYWKKGGDHTLRFSQNNFSDNWVGGGDNTFNINNFHRISLQYKKNRVSFKNTVEWRLDLQKNQGDTLHSIGITNDYLRANSSLGFDAFLKKWTYTLDLTVSTPLFNMYPVNSNEMKQSFLSPLKVNLGIGMKYSLNRKSKTFKGDRIAMSISLLPLSVDYTLVNKDDKVKVTLYGIEDGHKAMTKLGSTINIESFKYYFTRNIYLDSRFTFFTSYEYTKLESMNRLRFDLNRYLTTEIDGNIRFDDSVDPKKKGEWNYWQYNYGLSFGLAFRW